MPTNAISNDTNPRSGGAIDEQNTSCFEGLPVGEGRSSLLQTMTVSGGLYFALCFCALLLLSGAPALLNDPDTLWHTRVGLDILANRAFPHQDPYSHTFAGEPWIAKEWLSQVFLGVAYRVAGWNGVVALTVLALLISAGLCYRYLSQYVRPLFAAGIVIWGFSLSTGTFLVRPHIIALPFIIIFVAELWRRAEDGRAPSYWLLLILCVWANLHGSFTFGFLAAAAAFARFVDAKGLIAFPFRVPAFRGELQAWVLFLVACPIVTLIHPYGTEAIWSTVVITKSEAVAYIQEWRPFSAQEDKVIALNIIAIMVAALVSRARLRLTTALFIAVLLYLYLSHVRFMHFLFLLGPILLAKDLAHSFHILDAAHGGNGEQTSMASRLAMTTKQKGLAAALFILGPGVLLFPFFQLMPPQTSYPTSALAAAEDAGLSGPVYNGYSFGGALVFSGIKTFIDGRTDRLFNDGFTHANERSKAIGGGLIIADRLDEYNVQWTLLRVGDPRIEWFDASKEWQRFYSDADAVIHVPGGQTSDK